MSAQEISILPILTAKAEAVICSGDLTPLSDQERVIWYRQRCDAAGLDWRTQPFLYTKLNGKLVLYATKTATEQVGQDRKISLQIVAREMIGEAYVVTCRATEPDGRFTESTGAVVVKGLAGEAYCNALMKCETKSKRRAVLSLTGLGMLDETEVETVPGAVLNVNPSDPPPYLQQAATTTQEAPQEQEQETEKDWKATLDGIAAAYGVKVTKGLIQKLLEKPIPADADWNTIYCQACAIGDGKWQEVLASVKPKKPAEAQKMTERQDAVFTLWGENQAIDRIKFSEVVGRDIPCNEAGFAALSETDLDQVEKFLQTGVMPRKLELVGGEAK